MTRTPRPPTNLGAPGRARWRRLTEGRTLSADELADARAQARQADEQAPAELGDQGMSWWCRIVEGAYEPETPLDLMVVEDLCRTRDLIADLERQIAEHGVMAVGHGGQDRVSTVVVELRQARALSSALVRQLEQPSPSSAPASPASHQAAKAATSRKLRRDAVAGQRAGVDLRALP